MERSSMFLTIPVAVAMLCLLSSHSVKTASDLDPYTILGVPKSASQAEIKKVYKRLAREWHPDKNKNPEAEDMFIKITKSYEIISNEEKRANYDQYGQTDDTRLYRHGSQGSRRYHDSFFFDESMFHFPFNNKGSRDFVDSKYTLHFNQYVNDVLPDSLKRPYLIMMTSDWCFSCIQLEPVWKEVVQELEPLGVGIGVVDVGFEKRLANHLGTHRIPSILGIINGKVTLFQYDVRKEHLMQFVEELLPQRLVERVTDKNHRQFLNNWHELNKPHVLVFDQVPEISLMYKLTAFAYRDYVQFGYVDQGLSETANLLRQFNINTYAPTILIFKENTDTPADVIQAKGMKRQIIDDFLSNNKFLLVPRLVNQKVFDELCPVKQFHRRRKYCVLLITSEEEIFKKGKEAFHKLATSSTKEILRFAYVYQKLQQQLCEILLKKNSAPPQVMILERRNAAGKVLFKRVSESWNGTEEDLHLLLEELERLQKDPSILNSDAILPELNNEFAPIFLIRWIYTVYDYLSEIDILHNNWREMVPLLSLIFSVFFILFGTVILQAFSDSGKGKQSKPNSAEKTKTDGGTSGSTNTSSQTSKKNFVEVTELTDVTYTSNLVKLRPGHINVVLLLSNASKNVLLSKFAKEVYSFTGSVTLHFSFLNVDKHSRWAAALLRCTREAAQTDAEDGGSQTKKGDHTGYVLALNGHKKYFCLFKPLNTGEITDSKPSEEGGSGTVASAKSSSSNEQQAGQAGPCSRTKSPLQIHLKLERLGTWMERLMEGTLLRFYVSDWPELENKNNTSLFTQN